MAFYYLTTPDSNISNNKLSQTVKHCSEFIDGTSLMTTDIKLANILVCPKCKKKLLEKHDGLLCKACSLLFPVKEGIPIMLIKEAQILKKTIR